MNINKRRITAAEDEEGKMTLEEIVDEKSSTLEDNFDYFLSGIDKLCREGDCQEAISILDSVSASIESAIGEVSELFADGSDIEE